MPSLDRDTELGISPDPDQEPAEPEVPVGVLLVDDHRESLTALWAVLEPLGEHLVTAESGEQALRALLHEEIAVILLDVRMPGLDGLETARIIRSRPATRHIPIIFLTAQASEVEDVALAYATGAVDYVVKPVDPEILRAKVSVFVALNRERSERVRQSRARAEAEAVARTIRTLQVLSDTALAHLELEGLTQELLERTMTLFQADGSVLLLRDVESRGLITRAGRGAELPVPSDGPVMSGAGVLGRATTQRRPLLFSADEVLQLVAEAKLPVEEAGTGWGSLVAVPLVVGNDVVGLLMIGRNAGRPFDDSELELLGLASSRIALAIDHVERFAQDRQLVETLQRSLLPDELSHHPRLELAVRYLPSGLAPRIGGDWYDALELDANRTAVMIGDVVGHGVRAATTMAELRNALRAFAVEGHGPAEALNQLERVVRVTSGPGMSATLLYLVIDVNRGTITMARAGHPPPALRASGGEVRFLETDGGLPLGVDDGMSASEFEYPIEPGDTLFLFTDGLIERRQESITVGLDRLGALLADAPADVEGLCDHVVRRTVAEEATADDVAILAVRLAAATAGPLALKLPARPESVPTARHRLRAWLDVSAPKSDALALADMELCCSEAVGNVVRHAYGPIDASFTLGATLDGNTVELQISDRGRWRPPRGRHGGRGLTLMRALSDELRVDQREDGTTVTMRRRVTSAPVPVTPPATIRPART